MLETLEYATDELTAANNETQTLLTDLGLECENAELDSETPPTTLSFADRLKLRKAIICTRAALKQLESLEVSDE